MISLEQMSIEYAKGYSDKTRIYFIEKYLSTFNALEGKLTPFNLFPRQKAFLKSLAENKRSIAIKHRQAGITTITSAWITAQLVFAAPDSPETVLCLGNKLDLAQQLVTKIRDFLMQVPRWYWGNDYYSVDPKSDKNKKDIFIKNSRDELQLFNGCRVVARSSSPNAARGISSVSILVFDEAAFIEDGPAVYSSAVAATSAVPYAKIVMVSTPNGKDELYYNTYKQALAKENGYCAVEFKWFQDLRYNKNLSWYKKNAESGEIDWIVEDTLDKSGTVRYDEEKWRKLEEEGWTPTSPWYIQMCQSFNNDSLKIAQELDVSFMGSANNVVPSEFIEMQRVGNVREPLEDLKDPMVEETWFWKPPIEGHRYVCACIPKGEKVLTHRGYVNVEDVKSDDLLVTKDGEYTEIKCRKYREVVDEEVVRLKMHNVLTTTTFTWNHKIWAFKDNEEPKFIESKELTDKHWVEIPNIYKINQITNEELVEISKEYGIDISILYNEDFWWYCGMWLAEGWTRRLSNGTYRIETCHHVKETYYYEKIKSIISKLFDRVVNFTYKKSNATVAYFGHNRLSNFLISTFGKYAKNKFISEWVKKLPMNLKLQLVKGYIDGDGNTYNGELNAYSISLNLLEGVQDILLSCGIVSAIKLSKKERYTRFGDKLSFCQKSYALRMSKHSAMLFLHHINGNGEIKKQIRKHIYFSEDLNKIYIKIEKAEHYIYSGFVYNYETKSDSHSYCCRVLSVKNCDPSRGNAEDRTAIEIIDMDGVDENGFPILEQVMEFVGKRFGDEIGQMLFKYATMYNNAYVVVDASGGQGDASLLSLINLGYKNLYYEDNNQRTYTLQNQSNPYNNEYMDKLPGFHFQGTRFAVLSSFAGLVRNNEIKIRSIRVINELETWIFKGDQGRMDHMNGAHDDTITCLAMGLFVMQYSLAKLESTRQKDAAILKSYMMANNNQSQSRYNGNDSILMTPSQSLPFYNRRVLTKMGNNNIKGTYLWLLGKTK